MPRDDGRLGVAGLSESGQINLMERLYLWAHRHFPAWIDCRPISVTDIPAEHSFRSDDLTRCSMWGLPMEAVVINKDTV